jgi:hypothetical protein
LDSNRVAENKQDCFDLVLLLCSFDCHRRAGASAIVEAHGGTIEVASQPDARTTFTVRLPAT